jgi:VanZ family protein
LCLSVAMADEGHQWFYASRGASVYDVILDMSGASLAALITAVVWSPRDPAAPIPIVSWWRKPHVLYYWLPPVLWSLAVLAVPRGLVPVEITLGPVKWLVSWFAWVDSFQLRSVNIFLWKTGQALTFGILYVFWFRAFQGYAGAGRGRACLYALGLCLLVAMMHEGLQTFARTRGGSMYEVILDMSGASLAALLSFAFWTPPAKAVPVSGVTGRQTRRPE